MTENSKYTDSAGVPWQGRELKENPHANDDGSADSALIESLNKFRVGEASVHAVLDALAGARLLVPLVAKLEESEIGENGLQVDKSAELSIVTVQAPDGQLAMPVFSSVSAMNAWNPKARPVPNNLRTIALAAASEGNTRVVLDPMSETEFVIRRPLISALAQGFDWAEPAANPAVLEIVRACLEPMDEVLGFELSAGDPEFRLAGQELVIRLELSKGLEKSHLKAIEHTFFTQLADSQEFVELVDSVGVSFVAAN